MGKVQRLGTHAVQGRQEGLRTSGSWCAAACNFLNRGDAICEGPEYETIAVAGPNACITDPEHIVKFNEVCDNMGVDTIGAGDVRRMGHGDDRERHLRLWYQVWRSR